MDVRVDARHRGPAESANGGWLCGLLAARLSTPGEPGGVRVRLASPPPLARAMAVRGHADGIQLLDGEQLIATAAPVPGPPPSVAPPVAQQTARAAESGYEGAEDHPFPGCFVCGTDRSPGDGLRLRPGPVDDGSGRYATTWVPEERSIPLVWAALDCPGGWSAGIAGRPMVLGTMTAYLLELPVPGEPHVVVAWPRGGEGRKFDSGTALYTADGRLLASATATWISVDPAAIRPAQGERDGAGNE